MTGMNLKIRDMREDWNELMREAYEQAKDSLITGGTGEIVPGFPLTKPEKIEKRKVSNIKISGCDEATKDCSVIGAYKIKLKTIEFDTYFGNDGRVYVNPKNTKLLLIQEHGYSNSDLERINQIIENAEFVIYGKFLDRLCGIIKEPYELSFGPDIIHQRTGKIEEI